MARKESINEQMRNSFEVLLAIALVIIASIVSFQLIAEVIGNYFVEIIDENYGENGLFSLGIPDLFWILLVVFMVSLVVKVTVSFLMPFALPFHGYCPKCGVRPNADDPKCTECGTSLYRQRFSKFDLKIFIIGTGGFSLFVIIWYILIQIVGVRLGVDPGI